MIQIETHENVLVNAVLAIRYIIEVQGHLVLLSPFVVKLGIDVVKPEIAEVMVTVLLLGDLSFLLQLEQVQVRCRPAISSDVFFDFPNGPSAKKEEFNMPSPTFPCHFSLLPSLKCTSNTEEALPPKRAGNSPLYNWAFLMASAL